MRKNKIKYIVIATILILIGGVYYLIRWDSLKDINKRAIDVDSYITCVDDISANKVQINWKYVAAIIGVVEKNKFDEVNELEIMEVAEKFISKDYKLKSLEEVLKELNLSESKKEKVYKYIDDLKYYGLTPSRLQKDTKQTKFIESIKVGAIKNYEKYKILPSITIAQAILESNWGESKLASEHNNLFGIKADTSWEGEHVTLETTEFSDVVIDDKFRKYEGMEQSILDHGKFLYENKRYKEHGVFDANTYIHQAKALQDAGYSTLENGNGEKIYAKKLIEIIKQYNLQIIDSEEWFIH